MPALQKLAAQQSTNCIYKQKYILLQQRSVVLVNETAVGLASMFDKVEK
jgi:hypothetical protein